MPITLYDLAGAEADRPFSAFCCPTNWVDATRMIS